MDLTKPIRIQIEYIPDLVMDGLDLWFNHKHYKKLAQVSPDRRETIEQIHGT